MDLHLQEKVILISGGAKGIGGAIAKGLIEEGAIPVIIDPSEKEGQELLTLAKGKALHIKKRLFSAEDAHSVVQEVLQVYGRIDGLVNNAGTNDGVGLENGSPVDFLKSVEKNLGHYYYLAHYALESLKKSKGAILNISSNAVPTAAEETSMNDLACNKCKTNRSTISPGKRVSPEKFCVINPCGRSERSDVCCRFNCFKQVWFHRCKRKKHMTLITQFQNFCK